YADYVAKKVGKTHLKLVVDSGNGSCGPVAMRIFEKMDCNAVGMFVEPDGAFPNHLADPHNKSTLVQLQKRVVSEKADLGIALDGDGDRVYFIDEKGGVILPEVSGVLFVRDVLKTQPGSTIAFELRCSLALREEIEKYGGKPVMTAAGRVAVRETVAKTRSPFGTEITGHVCFGENNGFDDGLFASAKFASLLAKSGKKASALVASVPKYFTSIEYRVVVPAEKKNAIVEGVKTALAKEFEVSELDGVYIASGDYWGLLRASNTEPKLGIRFEGKTKEKLEFAYGVFKKALKQQGVELPALEVE
ncbi:MAG: phosphomannomutase, partial [Candidatus Micrarchaeota archaeon]